MTDFDFDKEKISGTLGVYVEYLSPKIKSTVYKYLIFIKNRALPSRERISIVTNNPLIQAFAVNLGMDIKVLWKDCDHLLIFSVNESTLSNEYISHVLDAINCEYQELILDYYPKSSAKKVDLSNPDRNDKDDTEDYVMGHPYYLKDLVRENPNPYPIPTHQPTPMYIQHQQQ